MPFSRPMAIVNGLLKLVMGNKLASKKEGSFYMTYITPSENYIELLRILASYEAKIAKICNFWTFRPVNQLINHLFKIRQKALLPNAP